MKKIYVSPSDQVKNTYAAGDTDEATQCRQIATLLVQALARQGLEGKTNLTASMQERVQESNEWGADLHVCLHTNAYNGEVSGTRLFCYQSGGEGERACQSVMARLAPITPGTSDNITPRPGLYEVNASASPCVYVEAEFHDVPAVALWIIDHKTEIAEAIAHGLCDFYGLPYVPAPSEEDNSGSKRYRTLADVKADRENGSVYLPTLERLLALGHLRGKGGSGDSLILDLSEDTVRVLVILHRAGLFGPYPQ